MLQTLAHLTEKQPDRFKMHLFVDSKDRSTNTSVPNQELQVGRISKSAIMRSLELDASGSWWQRLYKRTTTSNSAQLDRKILFLVCGPDQ
jgi:cytochrome-b5 reductase